MVRTLSKSYVAVFTLMAAIVLLCVLAGSSAAAAGDTTRVSVNNSGAESDADSFAPSVSDDGRYVAFGSHATNLVPGDTNNRNDVFVRDRTLGTTERVSVDSSENQANNQSGRAYISSDGRYVIFYSEASNLVPDDTNGSNDVFVRDRTLGTTERVSVGDSENQANGNSLDPYISSDGRYVVFRSGAANLISDDTNGSNDVFVRDRQEGTTERVSVGDSENQAIGGGSFSPSISDDGNLVAFTSDATNLVKDDTNGVQDVYVRDRTLGTTKRVSVDSSGNQANGQSFFSSISEDGKHVLFDSSASNLAPNDTNNSNDVFVHVLQEGTTERVSVGDSENQANGGGDSDDISSDGRYVVFYSHATNLVPGDTNGVQDVYVRDRQEGTTERVNLGSCGTQANGDNFGPPSISSDGRYVAFPSRASNLVAGDTNGFQDVFVHERVIGSEPQPSDCIAPGTTATPSPQPNIYGWNNSDVTITLNARDNAGGSGIEEIHYSATGADAMAEQTVAAADLPATVTIDAEHVTTISYFAIDKAGNKESPNTLPIRIDRQDPTGDVTVNGGDALTNNTAVNLALSYDDPIPASGVGEMRFSENGTTWSAWEPYLANKPWTLSQSDGEKSVYVQFKDYAGNESATLRDTIVLDTNVPSAPVITSPANNSFDTDGTITISGTAEANSTVKVFEATASGDISKGTTPVDASGTWTKILSGVSNGSHSYKAKATDAAGNTSGFSNARAIIVDKVKPKVSTATPTGTGVARGTNATATFSERMDPTSITTSTFKLFRCSSTTSTNCATQITNVTISRSRDRLKATLNPFGGSSTLLAGSTRFKVVVTTGAKDEAGNQLDQDTSTVGNQQKVWYFTTGRS